MRQFLFDGTRNSKWYFDDESKLYTRDIFRRQQSSPSVMEFTVAEILALPHTNDPQVVALKQHAQNMLDEGAQEAV